MGGVTELADVIALERAIAGAWKHGAVYLLLDGARIDDIHAFIYRTDQNPAYVPLYRGTYFESVLEVSPCLARADGWDAPLLRWALDKGLAEGKAMLLVADMELEALAEHFQNFLEVRLPNLNIVLFRFYDPVVFNAMAHLHEKPQLRALFGPCRVLFWHADGVYRGLERDAGDQGGVMA